MKNKNRIIILLALTFLVGSNFYAITLASGAITFEELHYGYHTTPKVVYWGGQGLEGSVFSAIDSQSNIITTFYSQSFSSVKEIFVVKFNSQLQEMWNTSWGNTDNATASGIFVDDADYIYVVGTITQEVAPAKFTSNVFTLKFRPNGSLLWETIHETPSLNEVASSCVFVDNNFYITGTTNSSSGSLFVQKYTKSGTYVTTFYFGSTSPYEELEVGGIAADQVGDLFIAARTNKTRWGNPGNYLLVKMNATTGLSYWNATTGAATLTTRGVDVAVNNGIAFLVGDLLSSLAPSNLDTLLVAMNATTGTMLWNATLDFAYDYSAGITVNRHGNPVLTGYNTDIFVAEFNQTGHLFWNGTYLKANTDVATGITTKGDFLYVSGTAYNGNSYKDQVMLLIYEDDYTFAFPERGPFGLIFGIMMGVLVCLFSILVITALLYTYWKK